MTALLLFACACAPSPPPQQQRAPRIVASQVHQLPLQLEEPFADAEFSSIWWDGDDLLILPQYAGEKGRGILALQRDSIGRAIEELRAGREPRPLRPRVITTEVSGVRDSISDYDGLEAVAVRDGRCFVLAEFGHEGGTAWGSRLVYGTVEREHGSIRFDSLGQTSLEGPQMRSNYTHEAMVLADEELWVLCELNGRAVTELPLLMRYSLDLQPRGTWPMPALEYRISDATNLDDQGRFWVINLFWPPDAEIVGASGELPIERLVPLRFTGQRIEVDPERAWLDLRGDEERPMYNWEGVARWGEEGFLLVTDSYPEDLLAYVERPE
ncbi:hypothetical protein DRQ53_10990 [bacterium]|nr:MAG: hypothetical protein DRQ32_04105 [bacterium]RKZ14671.1 MAG: hypothetical protein DRQ53_10990 [bacterium]